LPIGVLADDLTGALASAGLLAAAADELQRVHHTQVMHAGALLRGEVGLDWQRADVVAVETLSRRPADAAEAWLCSTLAAKAAGHVLEDAAVHEAACAGIVAGGGATGSALMDALGAAILSAEGEVCPLCPRAPVNGGEWSGVPVITKGGLVGERGTLARLVETLRKEIL
jgi:uncharacterized protein YgbK (DUF1537 family)